MRRDPMAEVIRGVIYLDGDVDVSVWRLDDLETEVGELAAHALAHCEAALPAGRGMVRLDVARLRKMLEEAP